ncbi:hypothetical protein UY3_17206 [Chelonia mydas]|uniref:Uncharacterized protein n=1 Tax=Chelonia mydas TaxID=8469 RepID=M7AMH8_CHEMY|nr:hypothetical protein UY3_17206 [Chelonia mydas]
MLRQQAEKSQGYNRPPSILQPVPTESTVRNPPGSQLEFSSHPQITEHWLWKAACYRTCSNPFHCYSPKRSHQIQLLAEINSSHQEATTHHIQQLPRLVLEHTAGSAGQGADRIQPGTVARSADLGISASFPTCPGIASPIRESESF